MGARAREADRLMANGSSSDIIRSLRRYAALMLGSPPWNVRIGRVRVSDDQRPVAVVDPSGPLTTPFARTGTLTQGDVQKARTLTIMAYPELAATAQQAELAAEELAELLTAGFERGLVTDGTPARMIGGPFRVPVYDFAGVAIVGSAAERAGPAEPYMHANVSESGFSVRALQDAMDELRYSVAVTVPLTWWRSGRERPSAPTVTSIPPTGAFGRGGLASGTV